MPFSTWAQANLLMCPDTGPQLQGPPTAPGTHHPFCLSSIPCCVVRQTATHLQRCRLCSLAGVQPGDWGAAGGAVRQGRQGPWRPTRGRALFAFGSQSLAQCLAHSRCPVNTYWLEPHLLTCPSSSSFLVTGYGEEERAWKVVSDKWAWACFQTSLSLFLYARGQG